MVSYSRINYFVTYVNIYEKNAPITAQNSDRQYEIMWNDRIESVKQNRLLHKTGGGEEKK